MQRERAERLVAMLRRRGVPAHLAQATNGQYGVRVVLPDVGEAVWDTDGAAGLDAQILRNGVLIGHIPTIPGSDQFSDEASVQAIAEADYTTSPAQPMTARLPELNSETAASDRRGHAGPDRAPAAETRHDRGTAKHAKGNRRFRLLVIALALFAVLVLSAVLAQLLRLLG